MCTIIKHPISLAVKVRGGITGIISNSKAIGLNTKPQKIIMFFLSTQYIFWECSALQLFSKHNVLNIRDTTILNSEKVSVYLTLNRTIRDIVKTIGILGTRDNERSDQQYQGQFYHARKF